MSLEMKEKFPEFPQKFSGKFIEELAEEERRVRAEEQSIEKKYPKKRTVYYGFGDFFDCISYVLATAFYPEVGGICALIFFVASTVFAVIFADISLFALGIVGGMLLGFLIRPLLGYVLASLASVLSYPPYALITATLSKKHAEENEVSDSLAESEKKEIKRDRLEELSEKNRLSIEEYCREFSEWADALKDDYSARGEFSVMVGTLGYMFHNLVRKKCFDKNRDRYEVMFKFKVNQSLVRHTYGQYVNETLEFKSHSMPNLTCPLEQAAMAHALADALREYVDNYYKNHDFLKDHEVYVKYSYPEVRVILSVDKTGFESIKQLA